MMKHLLCNVIFLALIGVSLGAATPPAPDINNGLTVSTAQGPVVGKFITPTVRQFLGIPYGSLPNGRWTAPQLAPNRSQPFQATAFGDSCIQQLDVGNVEFLNLVGGAGLNVTESENCLSVNVWAPSVERIRNKKTAVLVWIYGGGFVFGTSNINTYDGTNFVKNHDDFTLVTFNYRLNIFGQPNAPQLNNANSSMPTAQNFGLLDVEAAIQWVHDNIANFGGDPERISIFGQSAGAAAADLYTFSHPDDTIVKGIILESGTVAIATQLAPTPIDSTGWNAVANAVGCGTNADQAQFQCMQAVPFRTLENAVLSTNSSFNLVTDGVTVFQDTAARMAAGNFLRVPALGGSTANEQDIFVVAQELVTLGFTLPGVTQVLADALTLETFTCPASVSAASRIKFNIPTWRYRYEGVFPDISTRDDLRAYHSSEIPLVFNTLSSIDGAIPPTPAELTLSSFMQTAWVTFAQDPQNGLVSKLGLPMYNPTTQSLIQFGNPTNQSGVVFTSGQLVDAACANLNAVNGIIGLAGSLL